MGYKEIKGDLIQLALEGNFDVISHGCNCFCNQGAGIAVGMKNNFGTDKFQMELSGKGDINKLGQIDYELLHFSNWDKKFQKYPDEGDTILYKLYVVNSYTQYKYGKNHSDGDKKPVDYEAIVLCMRKINHIFKGKHIGLPKIGSKLAGGKWSIIKQIIQTELKDCNVTVVIYDK